MWLGWDHIIVFVEVISVAEHIIQIRLSDMARNHILEASFVYDLHTTVTRLRHWRELRDKGNSMTSSWVILGDFNSIFSVEQRINGLLISQQEACDGADMIQHLQLDFVKSYGQFFSWKDGGIIHSRIDHCMVNDLCLQKFPNFMVHY